MRSRWFGLVVAALGAAVSVWVYSRLPETVATHWNLQGMPDGYSSRFWAVVAMPLVTLGLTGLFNVLPKVDPKRDNYAKFLDTYWLIANAVLVFTLVAHALILANGLGYTVKVDRLLPIGIGLLLAFLGNYLTRVEPNWFIGVRTPWTLSSDAVWRKVHRTAGWLFAIGGLVIAAGAFAPRSAFMPLFTITVVIAAGIPVVQSYILWKREQHDRP
jgi:immunity protein, SdpI family